MHAARLQHLPLSAWAPLIAGALVACGGAEPSSLLADGSAPVPAEDAAPPTEDATLPLPDASPPVFDAGEPKDATPPPVQDAGVPYQDPGIACGKVDCSPGTQLCCGTVASYYPTTTYSFACEPTSDLVQCPAGLPVYCDSDHDCDGGQVCCGDLSSQGYAKVSCKPTCTGTVYGYKQVHFCDPQAPDCATGQSCKPSTLLAGYSVCQ